MSVFRTRFMPCPACATSVDFELAYSVNADRRPDLRADILADRFQCRVCPACQATFRVAPELSYLDVARGQWLAVHPADALSRWSEVEREARARFEKSFGSRGSRAARALGDGLTPRVVFGWAAFREKLLVRELGLRDLEVELCKAVLLRHGWPALAGPDVALRLVGQESGGFVFAWTRGADEAVLARTVVARSLYTEVAQDRVRWRVLRTQLSEGPFVDLRRLLCDGSGAAPCP